MVPDTEHIEAKHSAESTESAADVFCSRKGLTRRLSGVHERVSDVLGYLSAITRVEQELMFLQEDHIQCLAFHDEAYPSRLQECEGILVIPFYKGNTDLDTLRVINMAGTRRTTDYDTQLCATFLRDLKASCLDVLAISGFAYGIDINTHRNALGSDLPIVDVLAHELDRIYPSLHHRTVVEMPDKGGLLTEFPVGTIPDKHSFISRDRIVVGMCDVTIVVESTAKGGPLIIAKLVESHHRDCFTFLGRVTDEYLKRCSQLIRDSKTSLLSSVEGLTEAMGWTLDSHPAKVRSIQRGLFPELTEEGRKVVRTLEKQGNLQINILVVETDIPIHKMNIILFKLEMRGAVQVLAEGVYQLL